MVVGPAHSDVRDSLDAMADTSELPGCADVEDLAYEDAHSTASIS